MGLGAGTEEEEATRAAMEAWAVASGEATDLVTVVLQGVDAPEGEEDEVASVGEEEGTTTSPHSSQEEVAEVEVVLAASVVDGAWTGGVPRR